MTIPSVTTVAERYYAGLVVVIASTLVVWWLLKSRYGAALTAVRDDEEAAAAVGIDIRRIKTMVFVISAPMAGLAAAIYYVDTVTITPPDAFHIRWSAYVVFIVVAGGMGTLWGPIIGAVLFVIVQRFIVGFWGGGDLTLGIVAVLLILVLPRGTVGAIDDLRIWTARRQRRNAETAGGTTRRMDGPVAGIVAASRVAGGPVAAGLLPASPLPALRPADPPWAGLAGAALQLGERLRAAGVETVVLSSAAWRVPGETPVDLRPRIKSATSPTPASPRSARCPTTSPSTSPSHGQSSRRRRHTALPPAAARLRGFRSMPAPPPR